MKLHGKQNKPPKIIRRNLPYPVKEEVLNAFNKSFEREEKPFRIAITETLTREVDIWAEDEVDALEIAEDLCNSGVIDSDGNDFAGRNSVSQGPARIGDLQLHEVYDRNGKISDEKKPSPISMISTAEAKASASTPGAKQQNPEPDINH